jgi:hypothetical protein
MRASACRHHLCKGFPYRTRVRATHPAVFGATCPARMRTPGDPALRVHELRSLVWRRGEPVENTGLGATGFATELGSTGRYGERLQTSKVEKIPDILRRDDMRRDDGDRFTRPLHCHCANPACPALLQRSPANAHFRTATVFTASLNVLSSRPRTPCLRPLAEISAFGRPAERRHGFQ